MTIYTSKVAEKKEDNKDVSSPEVVTEYKLLVEDEKKEPIVIPKAGWAGPVAVGVQRRHPLLNFCAIVLTLILLAVVILGGISLYKYLTKMHYEHMYIGRCGVGYTDYEHLEDEDGGGMLMMPQRGRFEQQVDIEDYEHELIDVPNIGDTRRATVLHDFNENLTAIVDKDQEYCFLMQLNRSLVMPPKDFWDLLTKLKTGYYIPDVEVVRENYRAVTPPIADLTVYGPNIWRECHSFDTYKLVRVDEPLAMSKRSAALCDNVAGNKFCLGDAGRPKMLCIAITDCV